MQPEMPAALVKVGVFVLVQALVYLILWPSRLLSTSRMLAMLSDLPLAGEPSPVAAFARTRSLLAADDRKED
ncbi:hypothetical protein BS78_02G199100 [Paspalum vaginatum]|nr:hypothetical protein BS78_02G199100 [Paspalum vaginatum]